MRRHKPLLTPDPLSIQDLSATSCKDDSLQGLQQKNSGQGRKAALSHFRLESEHSHDSHVR